MFRTADTSTQIPAFSLRSLLPSNTDEFYRYTGSLTTPPCFESVIWTVFRQPINISSSQVIKIVIWQVEAVWCMSITVIQCHNLYFRRDAEWCGDAHLFRWDTYRLVPVRIDFFFQCRFSDVIYMTLIVHINKITFSMSSGWKFELEVSNMLGFKFSIRLSVSYIG